jgi:hypothetical protein
VTTRRSWDPPPPREEEAPLPANVLQFPLILGPEVVLEIALRQRGRATEKVVARHAKRRGRRR